MRQRGGGAASYVDLYTDLSAWRLITRDINVMARRVKSDASFQGLSLAVACALARTDYDGSNKCTTGGSD
jgi:hypothetical protein